ncbi:unnamed protein product [Owenia fusiformis]|uniref:Small RNA 2'-O-methyltransferase n=1 Tax=Owenia fusiformis TaxID=6347 RepID=A0A8S4QB42_OWEFU|nr:unnamed protein product [Owenia fusiformis]
MAQRDIEILKMDQNDTIHLSDDHMAESEEIEQLKAVPQAKDLPSDELETNEENDLEKDRLENENLLVGPKFDPPVYKQRYSRVAAILDSENVKSVIDFGCAECKFIQHLKQCNIEVVSGVDIDKSLLERSKYSLKPLITDYIIRRKDPLVMRTYQGSVIDYDARCIGYEAITMIEIIEHLESDVLNKVPQNVFGTLHPRIVIVTTPNSDFNVLFPDLEGFRHWDHKFEWSRDEFRNWCEEIIAIYPYMVRYEGIGSGPEGTDHLGSCSQMAIFTHLEDPSAVDQSQPLYLNMLKTQSVVSSSPQSPPSMDQPYQLICEEVHPHNESNLSENETFMLDLEYTIRQIAYRMQQDEDDDDNNNGDVDNNDENDDNNDGDDDNNDGDDDNNDGDDDNNDDYDTTTEDESSVKIPLTILLSFTKIKQSNKTASEVKESLLQAGYKIEKNSVIFPIDGSGSDTDQSFNVDDENLGGQFSDAEDDLSIENRYYGMYKGETTEDWD